MINHQANSNNQLSMLKRIAPWWFGEKLAQVKVNGWSNGWVVEGLGMTDDRLRIAIIYWPQYLQWFGLLLLGVTLGGISLVSLGKWRGGR